MNAAFQPNHRIFLILPSRYFSHFFTVRMEYLFAVFLSQKLLSSTRQRCSSVFTKSLLSFVHNAWQNIWKKPTKCHLPGKKCSSNVYWAPFWHHQSHSVFFLFFFSAFTHYHFACDLRDTSSIWEPTQRAAGPALWPSHSAVSTHFSEDKWRRGDNNGSSS